MSRACGPHGSAGRTCTCTDQPSAGACRGGAATKPENKFYCENGNLCGNQRGNVRARSKMGIIAIDGNPIELNTSILGVIKAKNKEIQDKIRICDI